MIKGKYIAKITFSFNLDENEDLGSVSIKNLQKAVDKNLARELKILLKQNMLSSTEIQVKKEYCEFHTEKEK